MGPPGPGSLVFSLTSVAIGIWTAGKRRKLLLFIHDKKFVVVVVNHQHVKQPANRLEAAMLQTVNQVLETHNPFHAAGCEVASSATVQPSSSSAICFEIGWDSIVGLDYHCCLLKDTRLVLEAKQVVKRVFRKLEDVSAFYHWSPGLSPSRQTGSPLLWQLQSGTPQDLAASYDAAQTQQQPHWQDIQATSSAPCSPSTPATAWMQWRYARQALHHSPASLVPGSCTIVPPDSSVLANGNTSPDAAMWSSTSNAAASVAGRTSLLSALNSYSPVALKSTEHHASHSQPRERRHSAGEMAGAPLEELQLRMMSECDVRMRVNGAAARSSLAGRNLVRTSSVPSPARWTVPADMYSHRTVVLTFTEPTLPQHLGAIIKDDMRLLKLYESGLPAWAVFLPSYGLYYRPWMRTMTWALFVTLSIVSMALGFYDLYKNVPYLKQVVGVLASKLYEYIPTASAAFKWLEEHTQVRLSILLTYLFSGSPLFLSTLRLLSNTARMISSYMQPLCSCVSWALQPIVDAVTAAMAPGIETVTAVLASISSAMAAAFSPVAAALQGCGLQLLAAGQWAAGGVLYCSEAVLAATAAVLGPPLQMLQSLQQAMVQVLMPMVKALQAVFLAASTVFAAVGEMGQQVLVNVCWYLSSFWGTVQPVWSTIRASGQLAAQGIASTAHVVAAAAPTAAQTAATTKHTVTAAKRTGIHLLLLEAWELLSTSAVKVVKALQAVMRFLIALLLAINRHRSSLTIQLHNHWRSLCTHLQACCAPLLRLSHRQPSMVCAVGGSHDAPVADPAACLQMPAGGEQPADVADQSSLLPSNRSPLREDDKLTSSCWCTEARSSTPPGDAHDAGPRQPHLPWHHAVHCDLTASWADGGPNQKKEQ